MPRDYLALIADATHSRALPEARRAALQTDLRAFTQALNRRWSTTLAARFAVTRGDEIEALLVPPAPLWALVHTLRAAFPDVDWVVACGRGPIATPLARTAPEVDGPCFHAARAALDTAKRERWLLAFRGFARDFELNGFAAYYSALYRTWTARQRRLAHTLRGSPPLQARRVGSPASVAGASARSHMRRRMAWPLVEVGDRIFGTLMEAS